MEDLGRNKDDVEDRIPCNIVEGDIIRDNNSHPGVHRTYQRAAIRRLRDRADHTREVCQRSHGTRHCSPFVLVWYKIGLLK